MLAFNTLTDKNFSSLTQSKALLQHLVERSCTVSHSRSLEASSWISGCVSVRRCIPVCPHQRLPAPVQTALHALWQQPSLWHSHYMLFTLTITWGRFA